MKGLLIKDFRFIFKGKRMAVGLLAIALFLLFLQGIENCAFIITYITMVAGMMVLGTISSDEYDKSNAFLMTMPIDRDLYAKEKYVFSFACSLAGWLFATVLCTALQAGHWEEVLAQAAVIFLILSLFQFTILPVQLKFGGDNGRMVLVGIMAVIMVAALLLEKGLQILLPGVEPEELYLRVTEWVKAQNIWAIGIILCAVWLACLGISLAISKRIMQKKEF